MHYTMRWFGPHDPVRLSDIRQAGCDGVVTALHQYEPGALWPSEEIKKRKEMIEKAGLTWTVVESLPVSEDIKRRTGEYINHINNYKQSIRNLAQHGIKVITYNFMPVLDWIRTNVSYELPDGSRALYFEKASFIAFDVFMLKRPGAESDYTDSELALAKQKLDSLDEEGKEAVFKSCTTALPGTTRDFTAEEILAALQQYRNVSPSKLKENLFLFLKEVVPVAAEAGVSLAIHPDDPPYPVLGLPRIVSTEQDLADILDAVTLQENGLCFCTGSLGARPDNDIINMLKRFGDRVHFLHLRNTKRDDNGNFYEAGHITGDTDMFSVIKEVHEIQRRRKISLPMRPDHGHQMLDDLNKTFYPGYSAIGRLKGLAELRGVDYALERMES
ncbi:MAG: mannonate dehydratase [Chitinophagaceae bacterium]|nr:mannonate dehydratase [Chitinophagaceae bacterium]